LKYNLLHANSFYSRGFTNSSQILCFFFSFSFYTPPEKTTLPLACLVRNRPGLYPSPCICSFSLLASVGGAWPALLGSLLPARPPESASAVAARAAGALPADATCATDVNIGLLARARGRWSAARSCPHCSRRWSTAARRACPAAAQLSITSDAADRAFPKTWPELRGRRYDDRLLRCTATRVRRARSAATTAQLHGRPRNMKRRR